jgi:tRNA(His) 5'-end guanylyltransferase
MDLGDRMKGYEDCWRVELPRRTPMIIRADGRAFHSLTRGMLKPWDPTFHKAMLFAAERLVCDVQGAKLAFIQSDEISVLATDYDTLTTDPWFGKTLQKVVSIAAATATSSFNCALQNPSLHPVFDARAFVLPKEEVCNYFIWRQQDAVRNSIQGLGQAHFSHKQLHGRSCDEIQEMLWQEKQINWNNELTWKKRGSCVIKKYREAPHLDMEPPTFTQDRSYVEEHVYLPEEDDTTA